MRERRRLANRREHQLIDFEHGGFSYTAGIGRFDNGDIAEIFLNVSKSGTTIETHARDSAIVASLALQHGVTAETIRRALCRDGQGKAGGPLGVALDQLVVRP